MSDEAVAERGAAGQYQLAFSGFVLSVLSFLLVFYTAGEEPYLVFRWPDCALNVGVGAILFVAFAAWGFACVRHFQRLPRRSWLAKALVCACLLWSAINLFYLGNVIYGYRQDMTNPILRQLR